MPKYRVIRKSWLRANGETMPRMYYPGDLINFDEPPGLSLEPLDEAARAAMLNARPEVLSPNHVKGRGALGNQH